jgi:hypothetical protein
VQETRRKHSEIVQNSNPLPQKEKEEDENTEKTSGGASLLASIDKWVVALAPLAPILAVLLILYTQTPAQRQVTLLLLILGFCGALWRFLFHSARPATPTKPQPEVAAAAPAPSEADKKHRVAAVVEKKSSPRVVAPAAQVEVAYHPPPVSDVHSPAAMARILALEAKAEQQRKPKPVAREKKYVEVVRAAEKEVKRVPVAVIASPAAAAAEVEAVHGQPGDPSLHPSAPPEPDPALAGFSGLMQESYVAMVDMVHDKASFKYLDSKEGVRIYAHR